MHKFFSLVILLFVTLNIHSQATDFITGLNNPHELLLDGSILYIAEADASRIIKLDLSDPNPEIEVVISGIPVVYGLAISGTELYFSQLNGQNRISKIDLLDPNPTPTVILENFTSAFDLEFYDGELYIAQFSSHRIVKIDPTIQNPPIIEVINNFNTPYAFELVGDNLYIATWSEDKIFRIDLSLPTIAALQVITNLLLPVGLTNRGNELYIAEAGQSIGDDRISKIIITDTNPTRTTVVGGLYNPTSGLVIYDDVLYIAENFKISKFELPALSIDEFDLVKYSVHPNPTSNFIEISGLTSPINYSIHSISGAILGKGVVSNEKIDIQKLVTGTYFLILDDRQVIKVVKE